MICGNKSRALTWEVALRSLVVALICGIGFVPAVAQRNLSEIIDLSLRNSPRVKMAEDDLRRASAAVAETKDLYLPSVGVGSGLGVSSGITLTVPTIFTVNAQSLVFNYSQRDYIRAARLSRDSAALKLKDARQQTEADTVTAYLSLSTARSRAHLLQAQAQHTSRLEQIVIDRLEAGYDAEIEAIKSKREVAEVHLEQIELDHRIIALRRQLAALTGLPETTFDQPFEPVSNDSLASFVDIASACPITDGVRSSEANARAKLETSFGDSRYTWRPEASLQAQYGRISPFNSVSSYYNLHGNYNAMSLGLQLQLPILDASRRARARESAAEAAHAQHEADALEKEQAETCLKWQESISELRAQLTLANLDCAIAASQLEATRVRINAGSGSSASASPMSPKEEERALLEAGLKSLDVLEIDSQLQNAQVRYLQLNGHLDDWVNSLAGMKPGQAVDR